MTAVDRQKRYRTKRMLDGDRRICIWVKKEVADALQDIASALSVTQKHFIENLLLGVKEKLDEKLKMKSHITCKH